MAPLPRELWVIDDSALCRKTIVRALRVAAPGFEIFVFDGIDAADEALAQRKPAGVIVDERLGDDSGGMWITARRRALGRAHVVLCSGFPSPGASEHGYSAADGFLIKPVTQNAIMLFVARTSGPRPATVPVAIDACSDRWRLSLMQSKIVGLMASGVQREDLAPRLKLSPNTVKHHIGRILKKSGLSGMPAVFASILQEMRAAS